MSQTKEILKHLQDHGSITAMESLKKQKCFRLSARILNLRLEGHQITTVMIDKNGKRYAKYVLQGARL